MNSTGKPPLGGFEQRLLGELRAFVESRAATPAASRDGQSSAASRTDRRSLLPRLVMMPRPGLAALGAVVIAAFVMALIGFSASSTPSLAEAFTIFSKPATGIPSTLLGFLRGDGPTLHDARIDVHHARAFNTPLGTGYVLTDMHANLICVAAPSFDNGGWGAACGNASLGRHYGAGGLQVFGNRSTEYVEVLPKGATATVREQDSKTRPLGLPDGVLAIVVHHLTFITTHIAGRASTTRLLVPYRPRRLPVPALSQVVSPTRFRITPGPGSPWLRATFRARYPVRSGDSSYVLEIYPVKPSSAGCSQGDSILEQTSRDIDAGRLTRLAGGAPTCPGLWRVTVYYAASNGSTRFPGQAWAQNLGGATKAPRGSGDRIVATKVITIR